MDQQDSVQPNCIPCIEMSNSRSYAFDHPQCIQHRPCSGWHFWDPEGCKHCIKCLDNIENMTVSEVRSFLTDFRKMLEKVKQKLNTPNSARYWEYDVVFNYFFRHFIHLDPARPDTQVNITQGQIETNIAATLLQTEDQSEANVSPGPEVMSDEDPFMGHTSPVHSKSLTRTECNHEHCIYQNGDAQCDHPTHTVPLFNTVTAGTSLDQSYNATPEQHSSKRKWSPANAGEDTQNNVAGSPVINTFNTPVHRAHNYPRMIGIRSTRSPSIRNASGIPTGHKITNTPSHPTHYPRMVGVSNTPRYTAAVSVASTPTHSMASNYAMTPIPVSLTPLPQEIAERDPTRPGKVYWRFNELLHERVGTNQMKIRMMDPTNTFPTSYTSNIIYKPGNNNLFETTTEVASHITSPYGRGDAARAAFMAGFQLNPSTADLGPRNSSRRFLDSAIPIPSGMNLLQQDLQKMDLDAIESATGCKEDDILRHFKSEGFQAFNFVNITGGWILTQDYSKFAKDEILSVKNFQNTLLTCEHEIVANTSLLAKEREARMVMLHSFTLLHYQELFTGKIEAIPVDYRIQAELTPDLSRGICRMQMAQLKHNIAKWMVCKMRIRKDILKDTSKANVRWMYKQTLWDADIFPKDSITRLRGFNNNTLDVVTLLGLKARPQQQANTSNANAYSGANTNNKQPYKRQRTDFHIAQNKANNDQNNHKKQGQQNQNPNSHNKSNSGNNKQHNNNQSQQKKQNNKNKKAFQKKSSNNSQ